MEQRLANTWHMTENEKKFIETALLSEHRIDGRRPFDYRQLTINFGREDGSSEVQLGQTHVMGFVTAQLVQPYRDRPNEGSVAIYTEFSPMADPSFEAGRPGESAVELGRIIDRGLRESMAVDTESLCVLAGKLVWSIRIDLHILDNGGNLVDAANIAALVALKTFRRSECTLEGEDRQKVTVHPPEVREPIPLIVHHLPIAMTFAFISEGNIVVIDPTCYEEAIMKGRMTVTINASSDICAIQKAGGVGIMQNVVMQCLQIAAVKAADITSKIETAVESYNTERAMRKIKIHSSSAALVADPPHSQLREDKNQSPCEKMDLGHQMEKSASQGHRISKRDDVETEKKLSGCSGSASGNEAKSSIRGPSCWDPYSKGVDTNLLKASFASHQNSCMHLPDPFPEIFWSVAYIIGGWLELTTWDEMRFWGTLTPRNKDSEQIYGKHSSKSNSGESGEKKIPLPSSVAVPNVGLKKNAIKTLKDAVKPKNKRRKDLSSSTKKR